MATSPLPALLVGLLPQDAPPVRIALEALDGTVTERAADAPPLADPRDEDAVFARYLDAGEPPAAAPGPLDERAVAHLHDGDRVWGRVAGGEEERLDLELHAGAALALPVDSIASLLFPLRLPTDGSVDPEAAPEGDRLYLRRGRGLDKLDGLVGGFSAEGVAFEGPFGQRSHPWKEVAALFVEDLGGAPRDAPAVPVVVDLPDGGRLSGGLVTMDADGVRLDRGGSRVTLPASIVREVAVDDGSFVFLSQLPVAGPGPVTLFGGDDDLGMVYPHRVDRSCMNGPLASGGRSWSRGIGVHAPSRLTWRLESGWSALRGLVALDDSVLRNEFHGSVVFRVHVDGEVRWESPLLTGGDAPLAMPPIELSGARELVLEVDPASDAFVSDRANWLRPILVRAR